MKKKLLTLLTLPLLLTSCGNGFGGSSWSYASCSAIYSGGETEATFFEGFTERFANLEAFGKFAGEIYSSTKKGKLTQNGCLNFTNEPGYTGATYKGKEISACLVNHENVSEYETTNRCAYFVDNGNAKFVEVNSGAQYEDYILKGYVASNETIGTYTYYDTSIKIDGSKLVMHLSLNLKVTENDQVKSDKNADVTLNWNKK